jgi:MerR family transcriptional regulator, light-induced transcriptional regulator
MSQRPEAIDSDNEPLYNIGAVSRITDIAETTLRVWERRYDFPNSSRTDGGHRLYSQNEVARLQWVKLRIDEGVKVSQAIKALYHMEQEGRFAGMQATVYSSPSPSPNSGGFATFYDQLLAALLKHDSALADRIIAEALSVYSLEHLIFHIISPIMSEMGSRWEQGEIDIASEHLITNFLRQRLLQWMRTGPPSYDVNPVVLAGAPTELHEGGLLMMGVLLRRLRWPVSYLGQSISLVGFDTFIDQLEPSVVVFVAMTGQSAQELQEWPRWLPKVYKTNTPSICYAGRIFTERPDYIQRVPGTFLGRNLEEGIVTLDRMLNDLFPNAR